MADFTGRSQSVFSEKRLSIEVIGGLVMETKIHILQDGSK